MYRALLCWMRPSLAPAAVVASLMAFCGCSPGGDSPPTGAARARPDDDNPPTTMSVRVTHLERASIERWYQSSGTLEAIRSAELVAVQPALITAVLVDEGDRVKEGQRLARLDGRALSLQADAARIELENLEAELKRLESVADNVISGEEIDKQRYLVEQARANVRVSRHQAKQTTIRAPFSGTIVTRYVDKGNLASSSTPLFDIADLSVLELPLHLPERDAATVQVGTQVEIELLSGTTFIATIERRSPVVDPLTGTVKFTTQSTQVPKGAAPGAFARAQVLVDSRTDALSLPHNAVFEVEGKPHVFVIDQGKASRRPVELGLEGTERIEILSGIGTEDPVVEEGNQGVSEGMPLEPASPAATALEPTQASAAGS